MPNENLSSNHSALLPPAEFIAGLEFGGMDPGYFEADGVGVWVRKFSGSEITTDQVQIALNKIQGVDQIEVSVITIDDIDTLMICENHPGMTLSEAMRNPETSVDARVKTRELLKALTKLAAFSEYFTGPHIGDIWSSEQYRYDPVSGIISLIDTGFAVYNPSYRYSSMLQEAALGILRSMETLIGDH